MNKIDGQGETIQCSCTTSNDVRYLATGSEERTREEVGCGGNEDVKMDDWGQKIKGQRSTGKQGEVVWACIEKRRRMCGQESHGDGGSGEKKER